MATAFVALTACSGGGGGGGVQGTSGTFVVLGTEPANNSVVFLNESIAIDFSNPIDITTANLNTVAFDVLDAGGNPLSERPVGSFRLERSPGDRDPGRRLVFTPAFPTNNAYTNGGLRPARIYRLQIVGGDPRRKNVLLDVRGQTLQRPLTVRLTTPSGSLPIELFENLIPGGPRLTGFEVTPIDAHGVALNKGGQTAVEVVLRFDEPLNPHSENVPILASPNPTLRSSSPLGRIYLEYDDVEPQPGTKRWIPARIALSSNTQAGSEVRLFPVGVLPNNALVNVVVNEALEDIAGESNANTLGYDPMVASFDTRRAYEPQFDAMVETFDSVSLIDLEAAFLEPLAEIGKGYIKASFDFGGTATPFDYEPQSSEVILNTDFTQIQPVGQPSINISGGVFRFDDVRIRSGVTVRGTGSNPMVWLVTGSFTVDGELSVSGGAGARVNNLNSATLISAGGSGVCGGGRGGRGSPSSNAPSANGEAGFGPGQSLGGGGSGGLLASCRFVAAGTPQQAAGGSGGGGGSFSTAGDPWYQVKTAGGAFPQQTGVGGAGCGGATRGLPGGQPGPRAFADPRSDNDFWGSGLDLVRLIRIPGELAAPQGGAGGGGGGDRSSAGRNWVNNERGGGGGGGGGVLIIRALDTIRVGATGVIRADGGHGGGGEQSGNNAFGGGGGGGSGGMVVLIAGSRIELVRHGETYANADPGNGGYAFSVSADGGVGTQGVFGGTGWNSKYPPPPGATGAGSWDNQPAGGFGGLGVVQLMAPAGNNADQTNTVLDDNIEILDEITKQPLTGAEKIRYLAWRGFAGPNGTWLDDSGNPTYFNTAPDDHGDIRPPPVLLPGTLSHRTRVRSIWIDTGTSVRRPLPSPDGDPRGIVEDPGNNLLAGPTYTFAGTSFGTGYPGYVAYTRNVGTASVTPSFPRVVGPVAVQAVHAGARFEGQPSYRVTLASAALGNVADAYAQHQARLLDQSGAVTGEYRILAHDRSTLELSPDQGALPAVLTGLRLEVIAEFFDLRTNGVRGLGPTLGPAMMVTPRANVQIGFAFHKDATRALLSGFDPDRLPSQVGTFLYDLADPAAQERVRQLGAAYVKWDVLFNTAFSETANGNTRAVAPSVDDPRPELRRLVIPYRF